jgi:enoyl-CoA hydratase
MALHSDQVTYERRGSAAVITIDRQERRNAIDGPTAELLTRALARFEADAEARVMILTGAGDISFCAGADLKAIETFAPRLSLPDGPLGFTRRTPSKPAIAAIGGWCLAGGLELALWCDLRIAAQAARLGFPERRFGVPLIDGGTQRLPRIVGLGRALDLILTGRIIDTEEAVSMGLVNQVVRGHAHLDRALELAEALAAVPQETMLRDRHAAIEGTGLTLQEGMSLEAQSGPPTFGTAVEGAARFAKGEGRGGAEPGGSVPMDEGS